MCLNRLVPKERFCHAARKNLEAGVGYKAVYESKNGVVESQMKSAFHFGINYLKNRWIKDKTRGVITMAMFDGGESYKKGFHISLTLKGAKEFLGKHWMGKANRIYKVKFKNAVITGLQGHSAASIPIVVAREIILKERIK